MRSTYVAALAEWRNSLRNRIAGMKADYLALDTSIRFDKALVEFLVQTQPATLDAPRFRATGNATMPEVAAATSALGHYLRDADGMNATPAEMASIGIRGCGIARSR